MDLNFSAVTRPVERLMATAQNGLEVLRLGGLETGNSPSPSQIVESVPMYKLRRYFPPDSRPGHPQAGPPVLLVHPMMMSANMWDVTREDGRGRHPARRRARSLGHRLRLTRRGRGRHAPQPGRPHRRAQRSARHRSPTSPGSDVHLAGYSQGGMFCYQAAAYRRSKSIASIVTFGSPVDTLAALPMGLPPNLAPGHRQFHGRPRLQPPGYPKLAGAHRLSDARSAQDRQGAGRFRAPAARPRGAAAPGSPAQIPGVGRLDRLVRTGDLRAAQAVHRAQPDDDRRLRHQRPTGDADRYHLSRPGFRRRGRRHRSAGRGARYPACRAQRRGLRIPHPDRPFRAGRRIQSGTGVLADGRRLGAVDLRGRRQAARTSSRWPISRTSAPIAAWRSVPG